MSERPMDGRTGIDGERMSDGHGDGQGRASRLPVGGGRLWALVALSAVVAGIAVYLVAGAMGSDGAVSAVSGALRECWPLALAPVAGWLLGRMAANRLYRPDGRVIVQLDPDSHMFRAVFVPEEFFRYIDQTGNNVVYHSPCGLPVYLARDMDLSRGAVDFGWVHTNDALVVMTRESAFIRWRDTLDSVLEENLVLMHHPQTIGLGYARDCLRRHLHDISGALGIDTADYDGHNVSGSEAEHSGPPEKGDGHVTVSDADRHGRDGGA